MARAALRWTLDDVAGRARVSRATISRFEVEQVEPNAATRAVIQQAFEAAGVEFRPNGSVRLVEVVPLAPNENPPAGEKYVLVDFAGPGRDEDVTEHSAGLTLFLDRDASEEDEKFKVSEAQRLARKRDIHAVYVRLREPSEAS